MVDTISRREVKYLLPLGRVQALRADLAGLLVSDPNSRRAWGKRGYRLRSLYFESHTLHCLREKLGGLHDRYKLRVRAYHPLSRANPLVLEIKRKHGAAIIKERTRISAVELDQLLKGQHGRLLEARPEDRVLRAFVGAKASLGAEVPLLVDYWREAFVHPARSIYQRATIDYDFSAAPHARFFCRGPLGHRFYPNHAILEVKTTGPPPRWLPFLAEKHRLEPQALSKFAFACAQSYAHIVA